MPETGTHNEQESLDIKTKNVYQKPLRLFSSPKSSRSTGYDRSGFCRSPPEDSGNHSVAGTVTDAFLDFSAANGNDLRKQVGLKDGDRWCLCAHRWKEAFDARSGDDDEKVPRVRLDATDERALEVVGLMELKGFAAEGVGRGVVWVKDRPSAGMRESGGIGGREPKS